MNRLEVLKTVEEILFGLQYYQNYHIGCNGDPTNRDIKELISRINRLADEVEIIEIEQACNKGIGYLMAYLAYQGSFDFYFERGDI